MPTPSAPGGYYQEAFTLKFTPPPRGKIFFSTDGSIPTVNSELYVDGIEIRDRSQEPNIYNSIQNVVKDWENYQPDEAPVPKGTVVRAIYVNPWGIQSEVMTQTYFVGIQPPERGYTLSLAFNREDLFGPNGIYSTGEAYDTWYQGGRSGEEPNPNFIEHLETTVTMDVLSESGTVLRQPAGLRIQGASARENAKKRFILVARPEISGQNVFDVNLFGNIPSHSIMTKEALSDAIAKDLVGDRGTAVQGAIPITLYLNGEYWYDGYLLERFDQQFFKSHYGVDDRILYKNGFMDDDSMATLNYDVYIEFYRWVQENDFTDPENWDALLEKADIQSFIDFVAINYFFCNTDLSDWHNYAVWRSLTYKSTPYGDLRWRWCTFDLDYIHWFDPAEDGQTSRAAVNSLPNNWRSRSDILSFYKAVYPSPAFRRQFVLSFMDILNNNFAPERVAGVLEKYGYTLDWMDGYFRERPGYAVQHLAEEFALTGSLETVTVSTQAPEMGEVTVNTSTLDLSGGAWSGQYFTDYPITLTAAPSPGYRFVGWRGSCEETAPTVTLPVDGGLTLEAVFAPE
ncbi:MAG: CotH kinase family protein [Eubacteriales bacterium]|nr:CotH kinase family protein [Eubacteriales bacterium]